MNVSTRVISMVLVAVAVVLGILAFAVGKRPAAPVAAADVTPSKTFAVVVASRTLDAGKPVAADGVHVVQMPEEPSGAYHAMQDVVGRTPRVAIAKGIPLTESGLNAGVPLLLSAGERGVAVPVDEIVGAGNTIQAGDYVDVFLTMHAGDAGAGLPGAAPGERSVARLLLAHLRVLAYGTDSLAPTALPGGNGNGRDPQQRGQARSAVLAVPLADVDQLILATQVGKVTLALRYPSDDGLPEPGLFDSPGAALTVKEGLPQEERRRLRTPENLAYAGVDSRGLAGSGSLMRTAAASPLPDAMTGTPGSNAANAATAANPAFPAHTIEVIRGGEVRRESAAAGVGAVP